jgi:lysyl endopeptidase
MMTRYRALVFLAAMLMTSAAAWAQISEGGTPPSLEIRLNTVVPTVKMPSVDVNAYLAEDATADPEEPFRFAADIDVSYNLKNSGVWDQLPDGGQLWRLRVNSPGAFSLHFLFDRWYFPEGAKLFIYNDDHSQIIGAFTSFNNWIDGTNITQPVAGDAVTIEYYVRVMR